MSVRALKVQPRCRPGKLQKEAHHQAPDSHHTASSTYTPCSACRLSGRHEQKCIRHEHENRIRSSFSAPLVNLIEERHNNAEAWLGLAASYDRLKRFDHAARAYEQLVKISGHTPTVLNNLAYHQMLKGDFASARHSLRAASAQAPNNPYIRNNIELLDRWEAKGANSAS